MRPGSLAAVSVLLVLPAPGVAQPGTPTLAPPPLLPVGQPVSHPVPVANTETVPLPGGTDVSQPLQPGAIVAPPPEAKPVAAVTEVKPDPFNRDPAPGKVLGNGWGTDELLLWWPKAYPLPPLVTGSRSGTPLLGRPETTVLIGPGSIPTHDIAGYRLAHGWSLNTADTVGFEGGYFFIGTRNLSTYATDVTNPRFHALGLPYVSTATGEEDVIPIARPGLNSALVNVHVSTRAQGAEANLIGNLVARPGVKLHALVGYRFFQVNEGLRVEERWLQYPTPETLHLKTLGMIADQFDGRNEFHGGQLGLIADAHRGPFFAEMTGKVALGTNFEVVKVYGETHLITAGYPLPLFQSFVGGVYAQPTNIGRFTRSAFAVVPEGTFKVGLKTGDRGRIYVGYNFLYISEAVRPGDQIDRVLNPSQIPLVRRGGPVGGPDRPRPLLNTTDFWVQGLIVGLETRF